MTDAQLGYIDFIATLKQDIQGARSQAILIVNKQLLLLYWKIGNRILQQQHIEGWGTKVIDRISNDLKSAFPDMKGLSSRNLKYMRAFAEAYPTFSNNISSDIQIVEDGPIVQVPLAQLTWYHHITILEKLKDPDERIFYIYQTATNGWSRNVLVHQIEGNLYQRTGKAINNFHQSLPSAQSDLAKEIIKDPYKFDFLTMSERYHEKDLENALITHIKNFLLELGAGFSYVGQQYQIAIGNQDFYIDLLFYHLRLRCFIVIELKTGPFIPEYASKLNFYLNVVDDQLRHSSDQPTIGILICKERNKVIAEYALRGINNPIGIAEYELTQAIPDNLKGNLPSIEDLERELEN
ncbi:MAG TPA: PDDEXK nuclease domain-containing protein [Chitinophaga sp.]|uniref:PDDEXK nuclease domain-containing protein n=1 Tax=Chitinophaga sp. TaxID=1869181 RepID=UPI002C52B36E|nr:PDDEXK nuclease domain-containing protein [Chitinophaga sp.]HVI45803.1 PDDEXK nuclease domain-containing protein [Chitinophaga sp.]